MTIHPLSCGNFKLDGGAMFGVVPKKLWERTNPADAENRIDLTMRSWLIEDGNRLILVDCGLGDKQTEKFFGHYALWGDDTLWNSLKKLGFSFEDVTDVFLTHLHFDHCGGAIKKDKNGLLIPAFPNAKFWSNTHHWQWATEPNPREKASFLAENIWPMQESGQLELLDFSTDKNYLKDTPLPFQVILVDGHTDKQMLPVLDYRGKKMVYAADLIPTHGHVPLVYVMGYDTRPLLTMDEKNTFLHWAVENEVLLFFEHDAYHELGTLTQTERGIKLDETHHFSSVFGD